MDKNLAIQNIYDDPLFFEGYTALARFRSGWGGAMEHAPFTELIGDVAGRRVMDLGCGGGQLAYFLAAAGAAEVTAIDASERMLAYARSHWNHPTIKYAHLAMEQAAFPDSSFDIIVSSLALHYVEDYRGLVGQVARWLRSGGVFVFSTEHPIYTSRASGEGWMADSTGDRAGWLIDDYADERTREHHWFVAGVRRYHRKIATLLNGLIDAGLIVKHVYESSPTPEWLIKHPEDAVEGRRPLFLVVGATRL